MSFAGMEMDPKGLQKSARYRGDQAFPTLLALGMARGIAAKAHHKDRLILVIGQRDEQIFGVEIFLALEMNAPKKAQRLAAVQNQVGAAGPARQMFGGHKLFKHFAVRSPASDVRLVPTSRIR